MPSKTTTNGPLRPKNRRFRIRVEGDRVRPPDIDPTPAERELLDELRQKGPDTAALAVQRIRSAEGRTKSHWRELSAEERNTF